MHVFTHISTFTGLFLLKKFRKAFDEEAVATGKPTLVLSASLLTEKEVIDHLYDVPKIAK